MKAIALIDRYWGIAKDGKQIIFIPNDLKRFKQLTAGHPVVMGRKTYEALPGRNPLPGRRNIILSREMTEAPEGFELGALTNCTKDAFVIGGESIYAQLLPLCDEVYLTIVKHDFNADQYFPVLNSGLCDQEWEVVEFISGGEDMRYTVDGITYEYDFVKYRRRSSYVTE